MLSQHLEKRNEAANRGNHARIDGTLHICIGNKFVWGQLVCSRTELANLDACINVCILSSSLRYFVITHHIVHDKWMSTRCATVTVNKRANRTSRRPHKSSRNRSLHHFVSCCQRINNIPKRIVHCSVKFLSSANCSEEKVFSPVGQTAFFLLGGIFVCENRWKCRE